MKFASTLSFDDKMQPNEIELINEIEKRISIITRYESHKGEVPLIFNFTPPQKLTNNGVGLGCHLDVHNKPNRFVTSLIYLNSLDEDCGGKTSFPYASTNLPSQVEESGRILYENGFTHTNTTLKSKEEKIISSAQFLTEFSSSSSCFSITPKKGRMILFYSRNQTGKVDHKSWHAGLDVIKSGKFTLQKFKEVKIEDANEENLKEILQNSLSSHKIESEDYEIEFTIKQNNI